MTHPALDLTASRNIDRNSKEAALSVVAFWRAAEAHWFAKDPVFDRAFHDRFIDLHLAVASRRHGDWIDDPASALALVILTDQFPRNAFRGTADMYATDNVARIYAHQALAKGYMDSVERSLRVFLCLPFAHSEDAADQHRSVALHPAFIEHWLSHAEAHRDIIHRFGRFPHRNAILGRTSTEAELTFLADGGFAG